MAAKPPARRHRILDFNVISGGGEKVFFASVMGDYALG